MTDLNILFITYNVENIVNIFLDLLTAIFLWNYD